MSKIKDIINKIESFENEDVCIIILSQEENHALLTYINNLEKEIKEAIEFIDNLPNGTKGTFMLYGGYEVKNILGGGDKSE